MCNFLGCPTFLSTVNTAVPFLHSRITQRLFPKQVTI